MSVKCTAKTDPSEVKYGVSDVGEISVLRPFTISGATGTLCVPVCLSTFSVATLLFFCFHIEAEVHSVQEIRSCQDAHPTRSQTPRSSPREETGVNQRWRKPTQAGPSLELNHKPSK